MRTRLTQSSALLLLVAATCAPANANAQSQPTDPPPATAPTTQQTAVERAAIHYDRGLQLYKEENFDAALTEFERAHELAPNFKILYSIGLIQRHKNNYAAALAAFQRYLIEGGAQIGDERRGEVDKELALLKPRCATITIKANVDGADVFVDDSPACTTSPIGSCVGRTPIVEPIVVNPGRRKVIATKSGYVPATSYLNLVGSDAITVKLELTPLTREKVVDKGARNRAILGWSITGVLTAGAVVTGIFALNAGSKLDDRRKIVPGDRAALKSDADDTKSLALVADILGGVAIVGGVISTYLTYKFLTSDSEAPKQEKSTVSFGIGPTGAAVLGRF